MNLKKISLIFLIFATLIVAISAVSAADVEGDVISSSKSNIDLSKVDSKTLDQSSQPGSSNVINTKVEAPQVACKYKKSNYFKVKVEERYGDDIPVSNAKLKITVTKNSFSKTFDAVTNYNGVAKINTKSLKKGTYNVLIESADDAYNINSVSKIFVGKQYKTTLKPKVNKVLKNNDVVGLKTKNDFDEQEVKVIFKKTPKHTKILKAKFYIKNKNTGKILSTVDKCEFDDDGYWELPDAEYSTKYSLYRVKLWYISH